jgi:hypothetical protein
MICAEAKQQKTACPLKVEAWPVASLVRAGVELFGPCPTDYRALFSESVLG